MPCYLVQKVSVEFKAAHRDLLDKALDALGWVRDANVAGTFYRLANGIELDLRAGKATFNAALQGKVNELKRAYTAQAVKAKCRANGWQVNFQGANKGQMVRGVI